MHEFLAMGGSVFYPEDQIPALVLFVSHRWEGLTHPDPTGRQLKTIGYVLRHIPQVASLQKAPVDERLRRLPSIRAHGVVHAALLLGSCDESDKEDNVWQAWAQAVKTKDAADLLDHVGIWYDYSCMPQVEGTSYKMTRGKMFENLIRLPDLVRNCPILILREENDDYNERGWCAAELAAARKDQQLIVVRMDLLGEPIKDSELSAVESSLEETNDNNIFESAFLFRSALAKWESNAVKHPGLWDLYVGLPDIKIREESRPYPLSQRRFNSPVNSPV